MLPLRLLARVAHLVAVASNAVMLVAGLLIPVTVGVSTVVMPLCMVGWVFAWIAGAAALRGLPADDDAQPVATRAYQTGLRGVKLMGVVLGVLMVSILAGAVLAWFAG